MKLTTTAQSNNNEQIAETIEKVSELKTAYDSFIKGYGKMSLGETWKKLGITEATSTGGFPMLLVGDIKGGTVLCKNTISGLNALADLGKYFQLDLFRHQAAFDPRLDVQDVLVVFNQKTGLYEFYNWSNFCFRPSAMNFPDYRNTWKKQNYVSKHTALDQFLRTRYFNTCFQVVMSTEEQLSHYQENIRPFMEKPFVDYLEAEKARWADADTIRKVNYPRSERNSSVKMSDDRIAILNVLKAAKAAVTFVVHTPSRNTPIEEVYDPANADRCSAQLRGITQAAPYVKFSVAK